MIVVSKDMLQQVHLDLHTLENLTYRYQRWPYLIGVNFSKPYFWVLMHVSFRECIPWECPPRQQFVASLHPGRRPFRVNQLFISGRVLRCGSKRMYLMVLKLVGPNPIYNLAISRKVLPKRPHTWRIIPVSKWLATSIYNPWMAIWMGNNPTQGTYDHHGYSSLTSPGMILQVGKAYFRGSFGLKKPLGFVRITQHSRGLADGRVLGCWVF